MSLYSVLLPCLNYLFPLHVGLGLVELDIFFFSLFWNNLRMFTRLWSVFLAACQSSSETKRIAVNFTLG